MTRIVDLPPIYSIPPYRIEGPEMQRAQLSETIDWGQKMHGLPEIWKRSQGHGIRVGVIDSGVGDHPDLGDPFARWNATRDPDDVDYLGHGTHVEGIIGARANGIGIRGIAPECERVVVKGLANSGFGRDQWLANALQFCQDQGCHLVNCSWGGGFSTFIENKLVQLRRAGIIVVAAIGNSGRGGTIHPGNSENTVGTASYNREGQVSTYSSRGPAVDVACPGEQIMSTWLGGAYQALSGTSMAAPFLTGALALAMSAGVEIDASTVREFIRDHCIDKGDPGHDHAWGWGILDLDKLVPEQVETEEAQLGPYQVLWHPEQGLRIVERQTEPEPAALAG